MSRLAELGAQLSQSQPAYRPKIVNTERRVRALLDGRWMFDTTNAKLVWESKYFPQYWIPRSSFTSATSFPDSSAGSETQSCTHELTVGDKTICALLVPESFDTELAGYVKIEFTDLDAWFEEQQQIYYHPMDPYHRVDILPSGRHVKVTLAGQTLADTGSEAGVMSLWETDLPGRWYLPATAVNFSLLRVSNTKTGCPYKGQASYYDAVVQGKKYKDVVWWYKDPTGESMAIKGLLCFYPDKVETFVDGEPIARTGLPPMSKVDKESMVQSK
ncbi:hypothetical protein LTR64_008125 [Lithohypha guttulata]|uniref:uncharacterized protein n=1 Tax=Lithohypha guttulata TaxID=1690604 RepID=UPI002DDF90F5|nr:hypothetical protein LTR51_008004 [Lithohypha guttulata]